MTAHLKNNFFIFTGGPGSGKSMLLELMQSKGYAVVPEVARGIIQQQNLIGGNATHVGDQVAFCDLMLQASIKDYQQHMDSDQVTFFDRGIPDLLGYARMIKMQDHTPVLNAIGLYRYNPLVFVFPPWQAIYQNDTERVQDYKEAVHTHDCVRQAYIDSGCQVFEVPKTTPEERVDFILHTITEKLAEGFCVRDLKPMSNLTYHHVSSGYQQETPVVVKLGLNTMALRKERECLQHFASHGAVKVLGANENILLMEQALPGDTLKSYFPKQDADATRIVCDLVQKLHSVEVPSQHDFYHVSDLLDVLDGHTLAVPDEILNKARALRDKLLASTGREVLLHGDLHHDNVLRQGGAWVCIDPKGFIGDPVFELAAFLSNPIPDVLTTPDMQILLERRILQCADHLRIPVQRIRDWHYVKSVLCWAWALQDGIDVADWEQWVKML